MLEFVRIESVTNRKRVLTVGCAGKDLSQSIGLGRGSDGGDFLG